jgi:hypothetical protein
MRDPTYLTTRAASGPRGVALQPPGAEAAALDVTRDAKAFTAAVRTQVFTFLRAWSIGQHAAAADALTTLTGARAAAAETGAEAPVDPAPGATNGWTAARLRERFEAYRADHDGPRLDPEARNLRHTHVTPSSSGRTWTLQQVLVDADLHNDWSAEFEIDLEASRQQARPIAQLVRFDALG